MFVFLLQGYCYNSECPSHDEQCQDLWGPGMNVLCVKSWWRHPLILPKRGCAVQQGMVFGVFESLKKGYTISSDPVILLEIVMLSPGTHLVKNHESQCRTIESQFKKQRVLN